MSMSGLLLAVYAALLWVFCEWPVYRGVVSSIASAKLRAMKFAKIHLWVMAQTSPFGRSPAAALGSSNHFGKWVELWSSGSVPRGCIYGCLGEKRVTSISTSCKEPGFAALPIRWLEECSKRSFLITVWTVWSCCVVLNMLLFRLLLCFLTSGFKSRADFKMIDLGWDFQKRTSEFGTGVLWNCWGLQSFRHFWEESYPLSGASFLFLKNWSVEAVLMMENNIDFL